MIGKIILLPSHFDMKEYNIMCIFKTYNLCIYFQVQEAYVIADIHNFDRRSINFSVAAVSKRWYGCHGGCCILDV